MKKKINSKTLPAFLAVLLYILILAFGLAALNIYPIYCIQKPRLITQTRIIAKEHLEDVDDAINYMTSSTVRILICDKDGACKRYISMNTSEPRIDNGEWLNKYIEKTLNGNEVFGIESAREAVYNPIHIWLVVGVPITTGDDVAGSVFLVKNLENVQEAAIGFFIYCTIFYWLGFYLISSKWNEKKKMDEMKQNYLINITHALKTPLVSMRALAEMLCDGMEPDTDKQRLYSGMILQEVVRQENMVKDALQLSKMQSNSMDYSKTAVSFEEVIETIREKYLSLCEYLDITLHLPDNTAELPLLNTNLDCVKQLMSILLDNSVKFVDAGGDIWIKISLSDKRMTVCVQDNGIGIEKNVLPHIFERFYKGFRGNNEFGNGLGLAIAEELVLGLKEKIWVESTVGEGSSFYFTVRLA